MIHYFPRSFVRSFVYSSVRRYQCCAGRWPDDDVVHDKYTATCHEPRGTVRSQTYSAYASFSRTNHALLSLPLCVLRCVGYAPTLGRDDRSHRVPRGTRGGLRADGHAGHQKSAKISKQSPTGESSPDVMRETISFASNWSLFFFLPSPDSHPHLTTSHHTTLHHTLPNLDLSDSRNYPSPVALTLTVPCSRSPVLSNPPLRSYLRYSLPITHPRFR